MVNFKREGKKERERESFVYNSVQKAWQKKQMYHLFDQRKEEKQYSSVLQ